METKKKSVIERLDELLNEIDSLPEDEQEKVWAHFDDAKEEMEDDSAEYEGQDPDTAEEIEEAAKDIAEKGEETGEQTVKDRIDESVAARLYIINTGRKHNGRLLKAFTDFTE